MTSYTSVTGPAPERDLPADRSDLVEYISLDPFAGQNYRNKPIFTVDQVAANANRTGYNWNSRNYGELSDGVLEFGFWNNFRQLANSYYLNDAGETGFSEVNINTFGTFNADQRTLARESIALWDDLIAVSFRENADAAQSDIAMGNTDTGGAQAYAYLPFGDRLDAFYTEEYGSPWQVGRLSGDVWIDGFVSSNFSPVTDGYYAKLTMVHELGHSLGLSHPGDYDALDDDDGDGEPDPITYANDAKFAQDSLQYSVMSYFDAYETGAQHIDWAQLNFAYSSTPLVHDIAAIQRLYGADTTTRTGDTVYGFNATANRAEFDLAQNKRPIFAIYDAGGSDTLDLSGYDTPSTIDLNPGAFSSAGGIEEFLTLEEVNANRKAAGLAPRTQEVYDAYADLAEALGLETGLYVDNISIAYGTIIENAIGGAGDDRIIGNSANNRLTGGAGADVFELRTSGKTGLDVVTDFGAGDLLAVDKKIADSNNDGLITWRKGSRLTLDSTDGDAVGLVGINGQTGLRYLGEVDGLYYYADARTSEAAASNFAAMYNYDRSESSALELAA